MALQARRAQRTLSGGRQACGPAAWLRTEGGVDVVVISERQQVLHTNLFSGLGIELDGKRAIVVKSAQHLHAAFASIAAEVFYVDMPGPLRSDFGAIE